MSFLITFMAWDELSRFLLSATRFFAAPSSNTLLTIMPLTDTSRIYQRSGRHCFRA